MKLALILLLVGWYATARKFGGSGTTSQWQIRCLNCKTVQPVTSAKVLRNAEPGKTKYSLATCNQCHAVSGIAIEPVNTDEFVAA